MDSMEEYIPQKKAVPRPKKPTAARPAEERIREIVDTLRQKKAEDIKVLNLKGVNTYLENFVIATATSDNHLHGLSKDIARTMKTMGEVKANTGTPGQTGWLVLDYIDIVVHLFTSDTREFYKLEKLWGDGDDLTDKF